MVTLTTPRRRADLAAPPSRPAAVDALVVVLLAAVTLALRWHLLGPSTLWMDDAWTTVAARGGVATAWSAGVTAPGFSLLLVAWLGLLGNGVVTAQVPALALGVVGVVAAYAVARWLGLHRLAATAGALLLALSPMHVDVSGRVKHYTLDTAFALGMIALAVWLARRPDQPRRWWTVVAVAVPATVLTAAAAIPVVCAVAAGWFALRRSGTRPTLARAAPVLVLVGVWLAWIVGYLRTHLDDRLFGFWQEEFLDLSSAGAAATSLVAGLGRILDGWAPAPAGVGALLVVAGITVAWRRGDRALLWVTVGPVVVAAGAAALQFAPWGGGRTDTYLYGGLTILAAVAVDALVRWSARTTTTRSVAAWAAVAVVAVATVRVPTPSYPLHDVAPLLDHVHASDDWDLLLIHQWATWPTIAHAPDLVGARPEADSINGLLPAPRRPGVVILGRHPDDPDAYAREVAAIAHGQDRVLVLTGQLEPAAGPGIERGLRDAGLARTATTRATGAALQTWTATE